MTASHASREALRQQQLLRVLWQRAPDDALAGWLRPLAARAAQVPESADAQRGLAAYRNNAHAIAERSLAAAFPTLVELVGADSFALMARAFWHAQPPTRGDLGQFGSELADFIARDPQLADEPYLADSARVDWAAHSAESAADVPATVAGLDSLASGDPIAIRLLLHPGVTLVSSRWPVATIWLAHRRTGDDRFDDVQAAFKAGAGEHALIWRDGWPAQVCAVADPDAAFTARVLAGAPLAQALDAAGADFDFARWLRGALAARRLLRVEPVPRARP